MYRYDTILNSFQTDDETHTATATTTVIATLPLPGQFNRLACHKAKLGRPYM